MVVGAWRCVVLLTVTAVDVELLSSDALNMTRHLLVGSWHKHSCSILQSACIWIALVVLCGLGCWCVLHRSTVQVVSQRGRFVTSLWKLGEE